jgi:hypothetical protein
MISQPPSRIVAQACRRTLDEYTEASTAHKSHGQPGGPPGANGTSSPARARADATRCTALPA